MSYQSMEEIYKRCEEKGIEFWKAIQLEDAEERDVTEENSWNQMKKTWQAMIDSIESYDRDLMSASGLVGKDGGIMEDYLEKGDALCGKFVAKVIVNALKMGCNNACMKRIVAAPTAGACGVLPAVLVTYYYEYGIPEEKMIEAMYVAAGVGQLGHACAMALKNLMGLVCDPVGGLVEVPCVKRNVGGAVNVLAAADMALAGIVSQIPVDQVIDAMKEVGDRMDVSLKETGVGGVAGSPVGQEVVKRLFG